VPLCVKKEAMILRDCGRMTGKPEVELRSWTVATSSENIQLQTKPAIPTCDSFL
jgi:hypothetical protein